METTTERTDMETTTLTQRQAAAYRNLLINADYLTEALLNSMKARLVGAGFAHYVEDADDFKAAR